MKNEEKQGTIRTFRGYSPPLSVTPQDFQLYAEIVDKYAGLPFDFKDPKEVSVMRRQLAAIFNKLSAYQGFKGHEYLAADNKYNATVNELEVEFGEQGYTPMQAKTKAKNRCAGLYREMMEAQSGYKQSKLICEGCKELLNAMATDIKQLEAERRFDQLTQPA